ncbi:MAG: hypothetical protein WHT08_09150 [Bryobacteraceae bacterium]|jgi:hypothetical protein
MNDALLYVHLALALLLFAVLLANRVRQWRGLAVTAALLLALTGAHNFMTRMKSPPAGWHALVGIKILLALHVIAMVFLLARGAAPEKERRWRLGALATGVVTMVIGLYYSNFAR